MSYKRGDPLKKTIFVVSDSIGETARIVTESVTKQFNNGLVFIKQRSYVNHKKDIEEVINEASRDEGVIVFTIVIEELRNYLLNQAEQKNVKTIDILGPVIATFERHFQKKPEYEAGLIRELDANYFKKMESIEFAVKYDDGKDPSGALIADIVLVGVSRTSKTPLSMYLAHKGYKVANYPLVPEVNPPEELYHIPKNKCVGLIIDPERLAEFRKERLLSLGLTDQTNYTQLQRILEELEYANKIMKRIGCPILNVSNRAIEETASLILHTLQVEKGLLG